MDKSSVQELQTQKETTVSLLNQQLLHTAESLTVVAVLTASGKEYRSNATPIVVPLDQEEQQTATPTIDPVKAGDTTISGTAEPGSTVTVTIGENEQITTETDEEGNWTVEVPEVAEGDTVTVVAQSPEKDPSAPITVSVDGITVSAPTASHHWQSRGWLPSDGDGSTKCGD